jgi:hypothetical protein
MNVPTLVSTHVQDELLHTAENTVYLCSIYRVWKKWCIITTGTGRKPQSKKKGKCRRKNSLEGIVPETS